MDLTNIRVLIWDFDGTLYKPNADLFRAVRESEYQTIINHTDWSRTKVIEEFDKLYKKTIQSATEVTGVLSGITTAQAAGEMEGFFDRRQFIGRDEQLLALFQTLKAYRHFILANGIIAHHKETLVLLGLPWETFEDDVTSEIVGETKPSLKGFQYILGKTGLPADVHLMIGDREAVDLVPAKQLGMKTCLVWADTPSTVADITLPTVYDVAQALGH